MCDCVQSYAELEAEGFVKMSKSGLFCNGAGRTAQEQLVCQMGALIQAVKAARLAIFKELHDLLDHPAEMDLKFFPQRKLGLTICLLAC